MATKIDTFISYNPSFLTKKNATELFQLLKKHSELTKMMEMKLPTGDIVKYNFGKMMFLDRGLIKKNAFPKSAWGNTMEWPDYMLLIKEKVENYTNEKFQTCVCIFYPDGNSGVAYHSDEIAFGDTNIIPSISLGEERIFSLREKQTKEENQLLLQHGSLLVMKDNCQKYYEHSLPINSEYLNPRINLTFRKYGLKNYF